MATNRNYLNEDSGWVPDDDPAEGNILFMEGNPSIEGALTGILTTTRNWAELHRWGSASRMEEDGTYYVPGLDQLKDSCMKSDKRGEAMNAFRELEARLVMTTYRYPNTPACDCTGRARDLDALNKPKEAQAIRDQCVFNQHEKGWWHRYTALSNDFGSRWTPKSILWTLLKVMGMKRYSNAYGFGYTTADGRKYWFSNDELDKDTFSIGKIEKILMMDEPNYRPKESAESKKRWRQSQESNRKDNEATLDQQQADKSWRHHDHYERGPEMDENGKLILESYPDRIQTVKFLRVPKSQDKRWEKSKFSKWFEAHKAWNDKGYTGPVLEKTITIKSEPGLVRNQPMVEAREEPERKFDAQPLVDINGLSNQYGTFELVKGDEGYSWVSGNYTLPKDRQRWLRETSRDEIYHNFAYGYPKWGSNKVSLDITRKVEYRPGRKFILGKCEALKIPLKLQQRFCPVCRCETYHLRDITPKLENYLSYQCKKHKDTEPVDRHFWGNQGHLKCGCCGMVAKTVIVPMVVRVGFWTLNVGVYGRFAEEALAVMEANHYIEEQHIQTSIKWHNGIPRPYRTAWWYVQNVMCEDRNPITNGYRSEAV